MPSIPAVTRSWRHGYRVALLLPAVLPWWSDTQRLPTTAPPVLSVAIGRPTDTGVALNIIAAADVDVTVRFAPDSLAAFIGHRTQRVAAQVPTVVELGGLRPNTRYRYQLTYHTADDRSIRAEPIAHFHTARTAGSGFVFTVQGDSHPERPGRMFDAELYRRTLQQAASASPDFHVMLGDDFSIERLIGSGRATQAGVDAVYAGQRSFLDVISRSSAMVLVNGNHEEAGRFLLDGTPGSPAVLAGRARNQFFALPAPDGFYTGDTVAIEHVGLPRDYYAWTWGDALFVVLDPYWHSALPDTGTTPPATAVPPRADRRQRQRGNTMARDTRGNAQQASGLLRNPWNLTLGDTQYAWLDKTLRESHARWKFVFAHHVLGGGRGGVELADGYEWGGRDRDGVDRFREHRPTWTMPIHQLFVRSGVTAFFQGHDHLYARQEKDGVVYQSVPNPADPTFTAFNRDAYRSGDILPNSGHLQVLVTSDSVRVQYVRTMAGAGPADTAASAPDIAHRYVITPRGSR